MRSGQSLGPDYTLLRFDTAVDVSDLMSEAARAGAPIKLLDVTPSEGGEVYNRRWCWQGLISTSPGEATILRTIPGRLSI
jgi:hypothetical protein